MKRLNIARPLLIVLGLGMIAVTALAQDAPSPEKAREIRERALPLAEQGNANAQYNLGVIYDDGYGVDTDYAKARQWYEKAAKQGYAKAEHNLGIMYQEGHGTAKNPGQAAHWFQRAAEHGEPASQNNLAVMYVRGQGVTQDIGQAAIWAARAAKSGNQSAITNLPVIAKTLPHSRIEGDNVNIRSLPSTRGRVLRQAGHNSDVVVVNHEDDWSQVLFEEDYVVGWVADFLLADSTAPMRTAEDESDGAAPAKNMAAGESAAPSQTASTQSAAPEKPAAQSDGMQTKAEPEPEQGPQKRIGGDVVNIRERPTTSSDVVFKAHRDQQVSVTDEHGNWRHVRFEDGRTGWVAGFLLVN